MTTLTVLFWNLHERPLYDSLVSLCHSRDVDFLLLAEASLNGARLLEALNRGKSRYRPIYAQRNELAVFAKHPPAVVRCIDIPKLKPLDRINLSDSNVLFFRINIGSVRFNLILVHLRSQMRGKPIDWDEGIRNVNSRIRLFESKKVKDDRTVVVGDFNMNPFDTGLVVASGFHAMMTRDLATMEGRYVDRLHHPFFYNPMWSRFGCESVTGRVPGTFYYDKAELARFYWHLFDQVLVRPSMLDHFRDEDLEIIENDGQSPLRMNGRPDVVQFSDHLLILFKLNF